MALRQYGAHQQGAEMIGNVVEGREGIRFSGLTSNPNALAINLLSGLPFAFCLFFATQHRLVRALCMGLVGLSSFVIVLTVSRSNIYPLLLYIAVTYLLHRRIGKPSSSENAMIAVALLMLCFAVVKSSSYVWERISRPVVDMASDTSLETRREILTQGPSIMRISPLIGVGLTNTRQYLLGVNAHDTSSALLGETGIVGTVLFVVFCAAMVWRQAGLLLRARMTGDALLQELAVALAGILCVLIIWVPVKVIFYQRLFWLWVGLIVWMDARLPPAPSAIPCRRENYWNLRRLAGFPSAPVYRNHGIAIRSKQRRT
jgi:O-antigen ligase